MADISKQAVTGASEVFRHTCQSCELATLSLKKH